MHGETEDADFVLRGNAEHGVRRIRMIRTTSTSIAVRGRELGSMERKADQKFKPASIKASFDLITFTVERKRMLRLSTPTIPRIGRVCDWQAHLSPTGTEILAVVYVRYSLSSGRS